VKIWLGLIILMIGIGAGIFGPRYLPGGMTSLLPAEEHAVPTGIEGTVIRKHHDQDRLLLTMTTETGEAILATFTLRVLEIGLLVDQGDTVTFKLRQYTPFVEDPEIKRVTKPVSNQRQAETTDTAPVEEEPPQVNAIPAKLFDGDGPAILPQSSDGHSQDLQRLDR